jgi:antitoxin component YwqK of YwqJK toxin-antitoxin module
MKLKSIYFDLGHFIILKFYNLYIFVFFILWMQGVLFALSSDEINSTIQKASTYEDLFWVGSNTTLYTSATKQEPYNGWVKAYYEFKNSEVGRSQIRKLCRYLNGRPVDSLVWKPTGERCSETTLSEGVGKETHWHTNGMVREVSLYSNGLANGKYQMWYPDGSLEEEGFYLDGSLEGRVVHYRPDGSEWARAIYRKGEPVSGQIVSYRANEGKFLVTYKDGKKNGPFIIWDESGRQKMEQYFIDGNLSGLVKITEWYENNKKSREYHYLNNLIHGKYTQWTDQGNVVLEGNFSQGKEQGKWKVSPAGNNHFGEVEYIDGKLQKRKK